MILRVTHHTDYRYPEPVLFAPHLLRFYPRVDSHQELISFSLTVDPTPDSLFVESQHGNTIHVASFSEKSAYLHITAEMTVSTQREHSFYSSWQLNAPYMDLLFPAMRPCLEPIEMDAATLNFGRELARQANYNALQFVQSLTSHIYREFKKYPRLRGLPHSPSQTFYEKQGSCRDFTVLQIALCRAFGLAARFTSGYHYDETLGESHELHAWLEVYFPDAGWRGFDASYGTMVGDKHIAICASAYPELTAPVTGSYWGTPEHSLTTSVSVEELSTVH